MQKIFKDKSLGIKQEAFPKPAKSLSVELDCKKYKKLNIQDDSVGARIQRNIPKEFE
jgi:penicillin-binding protein 1A